ncbi:MAG: hypothetical protein GY847_40850 [Proteobacteria bacterium]|nr:hypothetical protein [Pseudomonadota bacterium]
MLEFFRQHIGGLFGVALVGLLALAFAFSFGAQSRGWGKAQSQQFAATVNGIDIPDLTLKYAFNLSGGRGMDRDGADRAALQRSVLEGIIERQLLIGLADELGISASKDEAESKIIKNNISLSRSLRELNEKIESSMFFSPTIASQVLVSEGHMVRQSFLDAKGKFDLEGYQKFIRYYLQLSEEDFVEQQRLEIIAERMRQLIVNSVRVSTDEVHAAYEREHNTAKIEYIRLIPSYFADRLDPIPTELDLWAETHSDEIKQYYETNKFKYTNLEKSARARHILIKFAEDATDDERKEARTEIDGLLVRARAGEDFASLAREHSADPGSATKGGDLGFTPRGRMVPEFEDAMFKAEPGTITDVVKTKYGFHIIKVEEFREGNISLEDATPEIAEILFRNAKGEEMAKSKGEEFLTKLKSETKMADLIPPKDGKTEDRLGLKVLSSRPFSHSATSIPGIGEAPDIVQEAFKLNLENSVPDRVFEVRGDYYVMQLAERNEPNEKEFEKLNENLTATLLSIKQASWLRDRVDEIKTRAEKEGRIKVYYTPQASTAAGAEPPVPIPLDSKGEAKPSETSGEEKTKKPTEAKADKPGQPAPAPDNDESKAK